MKKYLYIGFILFSWMALVCPLSAQQVLTDLFYPSDFLSGTPGTFEDGLLGFVNPAVTNTLSGSHLYYYSNYSSGHFSSPENLGFFGGIPHFGFGFIQNRVLLSDDGKRIHRSDFRLALGLGSNAFSYGVGFGWRSGKSDYIPKDQICTVGFLLRPNRYFSFGLSGGYTLYHHHKEGMIDFGFRPFGNASVTLFSDYIWQTADGFSEERLSGGITVQPLSGVYLTGRYLESGGFVFGIGLNLGSGGISFQNHFDKNRKTVGSTTGFRIGSQKANVIDKHFKTGSRYLRMKLNGPVKYRRFQFFDNKALSFHHLISSFEKAIDDSRVAGIVLDLSGLRISREKAWEIRKQIQKVQENGKQVIIYFDRIFLTQYHLASVADRIIMNPDGLLFLEGFISGRQYLKGAMDKLGLGFEEWRFFKYKSAFETYSETEMSKADSLQRIKMIQDFYDIARDDICSARQFSESRFDSLVNEGTVFLPEEAVQNGLVDTLANWNDIDEIISFIEGEKKRTISSSVLGKGIYDENDWGGKPVIAIVYAVGYCDMDSGIEARKLEKIILRIAKKPEIKAVVLRVDSPGGDGLASGLVAEAVRVCSENKPVIVSQGSVAASGGYELSMYADTILAGPNTVTGSIGVIGGWVWNKGFGEKLGLSTDHVKIGKHADLGFGLRLPFVGYPLSDRNLTPEEFSKVEHVIGQHYRQFVGKVAAGRKMSADTVESIAQGRVWSGLAAQKNGLVDLIGGLQDAIEIAREKAGIPPDRQIEIIELPKKGWFNLNIFAPKLFGITLQEPESDPMLEYLKMIFKHPGQPLLMMPPVGVQDN